MKVSTDAEGMVLEGYCLREIVEIVDNLKVKISLTVNGIKATKVISDEGIPVNVTLCFSLGQPCLQQRPVPPSSVRLSDGWMILDRRECS